MRHGIARTIDWTDGGLRRTIEVDERGRARTTRIDHLGRPLLVPGWSSIAVGWRVAVGETVLHGASDDVPLEGVAHAGAFERVLHHCARSVPIEIDLHVRSFADAPAQLQWLEIRNVGARPLVVSDVQPLELPLAPAALERVETYRDFCSVRSHPDHYGGMDDAAIRLDEPEHARGVFLLNLAPGLVRRTVALSGYTPISTLGYDTARFAVEREIAPGASFVSDSAGLLAYDRDPHGALRAFAANHLTARPLAAPPVLYNTWQPFALAIDEPLLTALVDRAEDLGFEVFSVDDGWQERQGLWREHPEKFPHGLEPIVRRARDRGMRFGLWVGLAVQHEANEVVRKHPEWLARDPDGAPRRTSTAQGRVPFFCLATGYADWIGEQIAAVIRRLEVAYVKVDLTTVVQIYGERAGCFAADHGHRSSGDFALQVYRAIERIAARWRRERPDLIVDLTYELWGGHHAVDYALLRAGDAVWISNVLDTAGLGGPYAARRIAFRRARCVPPERLLVGNLRADGPDPVAGAVSALASFPLLLGDLRVVDREAAPRVRAVFDAYRRTRDRHGVATFAALESEGDGLLAWDGFYRGDAAGSGLIALFRNRSSGDRTRLPLPPSASGRFVLRDVLGGRQIRAEGPDFAVTLPAGDGHSASLLFEVCRD